MAAVGYRLGWALGWLLPASVRLRWARRLEMKAAQSEVDWAERRAIWALEGTRCRR